MYHSNKAAISAAYPTIPFNFTKFGMKCAFILGLPIITDTHRPVKLLAFFNTVAHEKGFHPSLEFTQWYSISSVDVLSYQVCAIFF